MIPQSSAASIRQVLWLSAAAIALLVVLALLAYFIFTSEVGITEPDPAELDRALTLARVTLGAALTFVAVAGVLLFRHIRQRLHAEQEASSAFELLRATMDNVSQGIAVFDARQHLVAWNARYLELRGLDAADVRMNIPLQELMQKGIEMEIHGAAGRRNTKIVVPVPADSMHGFEADALRIDGVHLEMRGRPMAGDRFIMTYTDVTPLKLSEIAHRDQATRLSAIMDNVVDAIVTINESGSIESWSRSAERLLGYTEEEVLHRHVSLLMPEPHASAPDGHLHHFLQTGESRVMNTYREVEVVHKDGRRIPVDLGISEMTLGTRRLFIGVMRDISARAEVERMKSGFVSTVSHELRTPLTSIAGSLGLLSGGATGELPAKAARLIEIARLNCERLVRLINDILDLEKAESGHLDVRLEAQRLKPIVQHVINLNRTYAHTLGVTIELEASGGDATVLVDHDRLSQVLTNLLSNAVKFSPRGGVVSIAIETGPDNVRVSVRDQGPGVPVEFQARIFQKFAQADSSDSRAKGGTGLGLSIVRTIMGRLGGSAGIDENGAVPKFCGACFYITLPIRHDRLADAPIPAIASGRPVLVCEDDPDVALILGEILRREGFRVEAVRNARAARATLAAGDFHVVIVDLNLPDADGLELIAEIRARASAAALPLIVLTARPRRESDEDAMSRLQIADWLQKPVDPQRLCNAVHSAIAQRA